MSRPGDLPSLAASDAAASPSEELPFAAKRAAETLRVDGKYMTTDDLLPFWRADNAVADIIERINEILAPS